MIVCLRAPTPWGWVALKCKLIDVELGVGFPKAHAIIGSGPGIDTVALLAECTMSGGKGW